MTGNNMKDKHQHNPRSPGNLLTMTELAEINPKRQCNASCSFFPLTFRKMSTPGLFPKTIISATNCENQ